MEIWYFDLKNPILPNNMCLDALLRCIALLSQILYCLIMVAEGHYLTDNILPTSSINFLMKYLLYLKCFDF